MILFYLTIFLKYQKYYWSHFSENFILPDTLNKKNVKCIQSKTVSKKLYMEVPVCLHYEHLRNFWLRMKKIWEKLLSCKK